MLVHLGWITEQLDGGDEARGEWHGHREGTHVRAAEQEIRAGLLLLREARVERADEAGYHEHGGQHHVIRPGEEVDKSRVLGEALLVRFLWREFGYGCGQQVGHGHVVTLLGRGRGRERDEQDQQEGAHRSECCVLEKRQFIITIVGEVCTRFICIFASRLDLENWKKLDRPCWKDVLLKIVCFLLRLHYFFFFFHIKVTHSIVDNTRVARVREICFVYIGICLKQKYFMIKVWKRTLHNNNLMYELRSIMSYQNSWHLFLKILLCCRYCPIKEKYSI